MSPLTCDSGGDGDYAWYYMTPDDFTVFQGKKRRRCSSCNELIEIGALCLTFPRFRYPEEGSIEERIVGEGNEILLAAMYQCEKCGDQTMNLTALGFCVSPDDNVFELLEEYAEEYGPKREATP